MWALGTGGASSATGRGTYCVPARLPQHSCHAHGPSMARGVSDARLKGGTKLRQSDSSHLSSARISAALTPAPLLGRLGQAEPVAQPAEGKGECLSLTSSFPRMNGTPQHACGANEGAPRDLQACPQLGMLEHNLTSSRHVRAHHRYGCVSNLDRCRSPSGHARDR